MPRGLPWCGFGLPANDLTAPSRDSYALDRSVVTTICTLKMQVSCVTVHLALGILLRYLSTAIVSYMSQLLYTPARVFRHLERHIVVAAKRCVCVPTDSRQTRLTFPCIPTEFRARGVFASCWIIRQRVAFIRSRRGFCYTRTLFLRTRIDR